MKTECLYDGDAYRSSFDAKVLSCEKSGEQYSVILDQTAFFPEQGGQYADPGTFGGIAVSDVQLKDGEIVHILPAPLEVGSTVHGEVDFSVRFDRMQNHTGEHIVSGLIHTLYGYNNVGFHLGNEEMTVDTDGVLEREQLQEVERRANRAVWENLPVTAEYPTPEVLGTLDYRSKLDLKVHVRIVTIPGYDVCACCAPHVSHTGEIGMIKILDAIHYKGGTRMKILCGSRALRDYSSRYENAVAVANALSVKQEEIGEAVRRQMAEAESLGRELAAARRELLLLRAERVQDTEGNFCFFLDNASPDTLREYMNLTVGKCTGICGVFSGDDSEGYRFVIGSRTVPLRSRAKEITAALNGRGGGKDDMISGSVRADRTTVENYILHFQF